MAKTKTTPKNSTSIKKQITLTVNAKSLQSAIKRLLPIAKHAKTQGNERYQLANIMVEGYVDPLSTIPYLILTTTDGMRLHSVLLAANNMSSSQDPKGKTDNTNETFNKLRTSFPMNIIIKGKGVVEIIISSEGESSIIDSRENSTISFRSGNAVVEVKHEGCRSVPIEYVHNLFLGAHPEASTQLSQCRLPTHAQYIGLCTKGHVKYEDDKWLHYTIDQLELRRLLDSKYVRLGVDGFNGPVSTEHTLELANHSIILDREYLLDFLKDEHEPLIVNIDKIFNHIRIIRHWDTYIQIGCDENKALKYVKGID